MVCSKAGGSYKCPRCYACYCSVACCKQHKEECSDTLEQESTVTASGASFGTEEVPLAESTLLGVSGRGDDVKEDPLEEVVLLGKDQQERLHSCLWLREALKSKRLREHILEVDGDPLAAAAATEAAALSPNGMRHSQGARRRARLAALRRSSSDFDQFAQRLLAEIIIKAVSPAETRTHSGSGSSIANGSSGGTIVGGSSNGAEEGQIV